MSHKYRPGESVALVMKRTYDIKPLGTFQIVRLLPNERGGNQYRIRSIADGHERVVVESELSRSAQD